MNLFISPMTHSENHTQVTPFVLITIHPSNNTMADPAQSISTIYPTITRKRYILLTITITPLPPFPLPSTL